MKSPSLLRLRQILWLYFILLLSEGALRKWFLPSFSTQLLLVRDPFAFVALCLGWRLLLKPCYCFWVQSLLVISIVSFILAITVGHGDVITALFGVRILLLHLPLIFLYASVFDHDDVVSFSWVLVALSIPMTFLIAAQARLPSYHILNVAPGGEGSASYQGALSFTRPPGLFSFITGVNSFFTISASAISGILFCTRFSLSRRFVSLISLVSLLVALPVSVSRSLLAGYLQVLTSLSIALILSLTRIISLIVSTLFFFSSLTIAASLPAFQVASDAFIARWQVASALDGAVADQNQDFYGVFYNRVASPIITPIASLSEFSFLGSGIGMGTNVGSKRLTGQFEFLLDEGSWASTLGELGIPLGIFFILWRLALAYWLITTSLRSCLTGNKLPLLFLGSSLLPVISGQLNQSTSLGFVVFSAGLTLSAAKLPTRANRSHP